MIATTRCFKLLLRCKGTFNSYSSLIPGWGNRGHYPHDNYITSIPVGFPCICLLYPTVSKIVGNYKLLATQAAPDEEEVTDEVLNQILATCENTPKSSGETCNAYVHKLCKAGNLSMAIRLLQSLRDKNIFIPNAYNTLLAAAAERNEIDLSFQIFKDLLVFHGPLSSTCYLNLARSFVKSNDCTALIRFVKQVSELAFPSSTTVINRIILAFAECWQIEKALLVFNQIKSFGCKPDVITYNTILDILGRAGRVDEMVHEFASMKEAGLVPDIITYNTLLNNLRKLGRLDMCLVFFREMSDTGVEPDLLTYRAMIETFGRSGNINEALRLFREMKQRQIYPSVYIYRSLICILKKAGKVDLAMSFSEEMNSSSLSDIAATENFKRKHR
ncbi:Tetratricopeptide repeat-like superfamily protein, putative isoform 1 [Theobroma cacao]|uniref:Tetratricopeptide repeat-like superfamily protein, putative isoform 1 n=2 Tax=Theobroma cacao TaxID=3641 RepID=A0A061EAL5_THECC|nr:Tetratricopeptide repeat-like superfamily protein, putative isoform 1 [Theobroma cacao]EOX99313.1 Tetratricopeptide repeat-like superfamily protein, putative isoform 1 [Theobroma cacao]